MNHMKRLSTSALVLAMALAVAMPSTAGAKPEGHGKQGRGHSGKVHKGESGGRGHARGGGERAFNGSGHARKGGDRVEWRASRSPRSGSPGGRAEWRGSETRDRTEWRRSGSSGDRRYRQPVAEYRPDARWRDTGTRYKAPSYRTQTRYRYADRSYSTYRHRTYYTSGYHRPRYVYRSGFSLGVFIGVVPSYGYRYFDPYCDIGFHDLDVYYDHCHYHGHPDVIQVIHISSGYPIASCVYDGGGWVVDDCY